MERARRSQRVESKLTLPAIFRAFGDFQPAYTRGMLCKALAYSLSLLLVACAQTADYQRPLLPVTDQWPAPLDADGQASANQTHWSQFFTDPRLHVLITTALDNNRDLRIATERMREARAQYRITDADRYPSLNLAGSASIGQTPADLSGNGTVINGQRFDLAATNVSYEVDFWGRLAGLSEAAKRSFLATAEARRAAELSLISEVASAYFQQLQLQSQLESAQAAVGSREFGLAVIEKGVAAGGAGDFELQQAKASVDGARAELDSVQHQLTVTTNKLYFLVGTTPQNLPAGRDLDHQGLDVVLAPGLPSEVLLLRPDVIAAEQRLRSAHANVDAARAAFLPKVLLTTSLGVASQALTNLFNGAAWSFQPVISMPLFDAGRLSASRDVALARENIAVADYEKTIQMAFREVADLLSARTMLAHQLKYAQSNEAAQSRRLDIVLARQQVGMGSVLDVLDGERNLMAAQQATAQTRRSQLEAAAQLYKALGGGA